MSDKPNFNRDDVKHAFEQMEQLQEFFDGVLAGRREAYNAVIEQTDRQRAPDSILVNFSFKEFDDDRVVFDNTPNGYDCPSSVSFQWEWFFDENWLEKHRDAVLVPYTKRKAEEDARREAQEREELERLTAKYAYKGE